MGDHKLEDLQQANKMAAEVCDCANLQFIGQATKSITVLPNLTAAGPGDTVFEAVPKPLSTEPPKFQLARLFFAATTKVAFLWAKTSLTSRLWSDVGLIMR